MRTTAIITGLFTGRVRTLPGDSRSSAIFKQRVDGPLRLTRNGLEGDEQADSRVHGGPDKALHHYPAAHYHVLRAQFDDLAAALVAGSIGENLSTEAFDDQDACMGDVYALGGARVQLCQPRVPCWKIDARYGQEGIAAFIERRGLTGWYYRVLDEGTVQAGDSLQLLERAPLALTVRAFNDLWRAHRPHVSDLLAAAQQPAVPPHWAEKLRARARWLHDATVARSPLPDE